MTTGSTFPAGITLLERTLYLIVFRRYAMMKFGVSIVKREKRCEKDTCCSGSYKTMLHRREQLKEATIDILVVLLRFFWKDLPDITDTPIIMKRLAALDYRMPTHERQFSILSNCSRATGRVTVCTMTMTVVHEPSICEGQR
jgi:hypothetical protein